MQASDFIQQVKASNPSVNLPDSEIIAKGREAGFQIEEGSGDIFSQSAQFLGNVAGGAISEIPKAAANIVAFAPRILGKGLSSVGATGIGERLQTGADFIGGIGAEGKSAIESNAGDIGYEKDSIGSAIGSIGTDIAASFLIPGGPAMKGAGYLKSAAAGAVDMAKFAAAERGDLPSLGEAASGAGFGVGFKAAGKVLGAASQKLTLAGLMNPARLRAVNEALAKGGDEILAKEGDLAGFFQNRKIYGSKEEISAKLEDVAATAKQKLDKGIASVNGTFKSEGVTSMIQSLRNSTPTLAGITSPKAAILDDLLDKSSKIGLNLQELNQVKRIIDDTINIFKRSGEEASGQKASEWALYRNQLKRDIEDIAAEAGFKDVRALNNEIAVSKTAAEAITGKLAADQARDLLSMFVIRPGGGAFLGAGSQLGSGDPWQILQGAIFGAIAGGLTNTAVTSRVGYLLSKLSPKETGALKAFLDTRGEAALPVAIEGKIKNAADSLKKQKKRIWDYEKDVVKKEDIFGNVRYEGKKGPLVDSSKAEEAAAYFDNISPIYGPEKAAARTEMEYGTNNVKRADIRKAASKNRDTLFEEGASTTEDIGNQFEQAGNIGKRPSAPSMGGETAEDIVKGWGSVPADVVEEYVALSDRAKQYLLPYNPKTGVQLLPERGTEMARSVQGVQSRSKKIELPEGAKVAKEVETPVLAQAKGKETNLQSAKESGSVVESKNMKSKPVDLVEDVKKTVNSELPDGVVKMKMNIGGKEVEMYGAPQVNRSTGETGKFHDLFKTPEEAAEQVKTNKAWKEEARSRSERIEAKKKSEEAVNAEKNDIDGFGSELTPIARGRVVAALEKTHMIRTADGGVKTVKVKDFVRDTVENGGEIKEYQVPVVKDVSASRYNKMTMEQQRMHEKEMAKGETKTEYSVGGYNLGKTAYDYAKYLKSKK